MIIISPARKLTIIENIKSKKKITKTLGPQLADKIEIYKKKLSFRK